MRRWAVIAFAVLASVLVATTPVEAATATKIVAQNNTAAEFNNAQELTNVTVTGSGTDAFVELTGTSNSTIDGFEDGDITEYGGDTGEYATNTTTVKVGSTSLRHDSASSGRIASNDFSTSLGNNYSVWIRSSSERSAAAAGLNIFTQQEDNTPQGYVAQLQFDSNNIRILEDDGGLSALASSSTSEALNQDQWYHLFFETTDSGTLVARVVKEDGTQIGNVSTTDPTFSSGGIGFYGERQEFYDEVVNESAGTTKGTYISQNVSASNLQTVKFNLTVTNVSAITTVQEFNTTSDAWQDVTSQIFTTTANHSVDASSATFGKIRTNVTFQQNDDLPVTGELHDETFLATTHDPEFNDSTASPANGEDLTDDSVTLEIQLNDTDFGKAHDDSVDVEFFVNGTSQGTTTLTDNGTASLTYTEDTGGAREWNATATDSYGNTNTSATFTYNAPAVLEIREETVPHDKITGGTVEVMFFEQEDDNPTIVNRSITDGNVSLKGLPVGSEFVAQIETPGYHNRTVLIDSLYDQKTAFLVNTSVPSNEVTFSVNDETGDFDQDAQFVVQKAINRSLYNGTPSGFSWTNVAGDEIGSQNAFTTDLIFEDRYRLRISNDDGDTRLLGAHIPKSDQTVTVTIQDVDLTIQNHTTDLAIGFEKDTENNQVEFLYNDTTGQTTDLEVIIYERGNRSNEVHNETHAGPFGNLFIEKTITNDELNASWVVQFEGTRNGKTIDGQYVTGGRGDIDISAVPQWVREFASVFVILLIPTLLGGSRAETAAVVSTAVSAVAWYVRWLPPEISIMSILLAAAIAIGFKFRQRGQGNII